MVSLLFFIDIIIPAELWSKGLTQPVREMIERNISRGYEAQCLNHLCHHVTRYENKKKVLSNVTKHFISAVVSEKYETSANVRILMCAIPVVRVTN